MYTSIFIYSNRCVAFASSMSSDVRSMKRMTLTLSVPNHMYTDLHLLNGYVAFASLVPNNDVSNPVVRVCVDGVVT
jgi:hypothetical protein